MTHPADPLPTISPPSPWVVQHAGLVPTGGQVLDLAAGSGRHSRYFNSLGYSVLAVDRDVNGLAELRGQSGIELLELDLETTNVWPLAGRFFAGIVVTNYLHRPLLPHLAASLTPGGVLIYETFAIGNEGFGGRAIRISCCGRANCWNWPGRPASPFWPTSRSRLASQGPP